MKYNGQCWQQILIKDVCTAVSKGSEWEAWLSQETRSVHLAVFVEPYLRYILQGRKTVESRFSAVRCAPYGSVQTGDILLLKKAGGPVVGMCEVTQVWHYELDPASWQEIRRSFTAALCAQNPGFWKDRENAAFATLMRVGHVTPVAPLPCSKRDRRGWVVLRRPVRANASGE